MPIKTHFVLKGLQKIGIDEYLESELRKAGYGGVDIQKTPLGTRFTIYATRPGFVIGRRGKTVRDLTESLKRNFNVDNPQIEVAEVEIPEFDAKIMASKLASSLERGFQYRRAAYGVMRRIMEAGAKGAEITISGKLSSQRARYQKFKEGVVTKSGEPVKTFVREATSPAFLKPGVVGVRVVIMLPGEMPDKIKVTYPQIPQPVAKPETAKIAPVTEPPKVTTEVQPEPKAAPEQQEVTQKESAEQALTDVKKEEPKKEKVAEKKEKKPKRVAAEGKEEKSAEEPKKPKRAQKKKEK